MKKITVLVIAIGILLSTSTYSMAFKLEADVSEELGSLVINDRESFDGYTLLNPLLGKNTYLINNTNKKIVHKWHSDHRVTLAAYLLENGNLVRNSAIFFNPLSWLFNPFLWQGGCGGRVEIFDWDGNLIWDFTYMGDTYCLHNDVEVLPNGNVIMTVWESKTRDEVIAAGGDTDHLVFLKEGYLLMDYLIEVEPTGPTSGDIVWEWHFWDHLIQDHDASKDNYGVVADHPELIDINHEGSCYGDITHINSVEYNETYDQLLISSRQASEIWIIDHSTTTEEAAGHTGGRYGKGGDLLYRWGNPQNYGRGDETDQKLFRQHDARWVEPGCPGEGHITIFNNGYERPGGNYSSVEEIIPPMDENGNYILEPGSAYGPEETVWTYNAKNPKDFYSGFMSGAQRLPNGNTFICSGDPGHLYEVTPEKEIIWDYLNPYPIYIPFFDFGIFEHLNQVFKTQCYTKNYPGIGELSTSIESGTLDSEVTFIEDSQNIEQQSLASGSPSNN